MNDQRAVMERMLQKGVVRVFLNTNTPGVVLPALPTGAVLALNFSYRFEPGDLTVDDSGIKSTLSFNRVACAVVVPWTAVIGLLSTVLDELVQFETTSNEPMFKRASGDFQPAMIAKFKPSLVPNEEGVTKMFSPPRTGHLRLLKN
jgi:hypothetical protein